MLAHASTCLHISIEKNKFFFKYTSWQISDTSRDTSQQVTSKTPAGKQKDPKKVAAGKALQEKNRKAREEQRKIFEAQKKALDEANLKIAKYETPAVDTPVDTPVDKNVLTTTQWLSVISIVVSLAGICYKREDIKGLFAKPTPAPSPVDFAPKPAPTRGIKPMD